MFPRRIRITRVLILFDFPHMETPYQPTETETMRRLEVTIDDPRRDEARRPVGFDDPNEAHRFADAQARQLPTDACVQVYDNEAQAYCGHYCGQGAPPDAADELPTLELFGADHAQVQAF